MIVLIVYLSHDQLRQSQHSQNLSMTVLSWTSYNINSSIYAYKRNVIFLGQGKIRKVCKWSGKGIGVQPQSLFSGKKFSENTVKIIPKKSKMKSRVVLIFFSGIFFINFGC